jgi:hypothetical protein
MSRRVFSFCFVAAFMSPTIAFSQSFLSQYQGLPYHDTRYSGGPQKIPGKILCAYYDMGGEGVAYHDTDPENHGSGELNPADGLYLNEFRIHEGADTPYVGWTEPGEWFNLTVVVAQSGTYAADFLYTSNGGGTISVGVNGKDATGPLQIHSTHLSRLPPIHHDRLGHLVTGFLHG